MFAGKKRFVSLASVKEKKPRAVTAGYIKKSRYLCIGFQEKTSIFFHKFVIGCLLL